MSTATFKLARQFRGKGYYAEVTVSVELVDVNAVTVAEDAFSWLKDEYGPDAHEWTACDEYRDGAIFGASYALAHVERPHPGARVTVTRIHAHPAHSERGAVAFAACYATWQALDDNGVSPPELGDGVTFPVGGA